MFFGLAMVIFLDNRWVGLFCLVWATAIIAIPRIAFGWHYPSDIAGSAVLGPGFVFFFERISYFRILMERAVNFFYKRMFLVNSILFVFFAETINLVAWLRSMCINFLN